MVSVKEAIKIGEVNFGEYKTEFFVMPRVKEYFDEKSVSLAFLLPEGWTWYESTLLECLENAKEEDPDSEFGQEFRVIYTGVIENNPSGDSEDSEETGFNDMPEDAGEIIFGSSSQNMKNQNFYVKYIALGKLKD